MKNQNNVFFSIDLLKNTLSSQQLQKGTFGLEREGLRVQENGQLALTPHPPVFGNKLTNPFITTDFSESQIELITPVCSSVAAAYERLAELCDFVETSLLPNEFFWPQSMPCIIPNDENIPIAVYSGDVKKSETAMAYRRGLMEKYGGKKQLISGIHFNFGMDEETLEILYHHSIAKADQNVNMRRLFKDSVYLKILRGYLRYRWLIVYLTGCSVGFHNSFCDLKTLQVEPIDAFGSCLQTAGPSFRNSVYGYKNLQPLFPDYTSVASFAKDVEKFVAKGILSAPKELYTQVRMKGKDPAHLLDSLRSDGIQYIEVRTVDLNPYDPCGISQRDMVFLHHFLLWLLTVPEAKITDCQAEALKNEEITALKGFEPDCNLLCNGKSVKLREWGKRILLSMKEMEEALDFGEIALIDEMIERVQNPNITYASRLMQDIRQKGFICSQMEIAQAYKRQHVHRKVMLRDYESFDGESQTAIKAVRRFGKVSENDRNE